MQPKQAKELAARVWEQFPNPVRGDQPQEDRESYCVGGSLCLYAGKPASREQYGWHFPLCESLALVLEELNEELSREEPTDDRPGRSSMYLACEIINNNDAGRFAQARAVVLKALSWQYEPDEHA